MLLMIKLLNTEMRNKKVNYMKLNTHHAATKKFSFLSNLS